MTNRYTRRPVKAPRLSGSLLRLVCGLLETPLIGSLIAKKTLTDLGLPALIKHDAAGGHPLIPHLLEPITAPANKTNDDNLNLFAKQGPRPIPTSADYRFAYQNQTLTPQQVGELVVQRTQESESATPALRALIAQQASDIEEQAQASTERWAKGQPIGLLDGVPVAIKDELDAVPYPTTVGTSFLGESPAVKDAHAVARLRAAGALIIGKANMHELGLGVTGINPHHGAARNPYAPSHATGGSSSGSAAAVAAGLCPLAVGADGGGSIRIPSSLCGIYGLKPTFGRISETHVAELCWSVAHLGPMASNPADLALGLSLMSGVDPSDPMTLNRPVCDLSAAHESKLSGLRVGIYRPWFEDADSDVVAACNQAIDTLKAAGAELVDVTVFAPDLTRITHMVTIVSEMLAAQGSDGLDRRAHYGLDVRMNFALARFLTSRDYVHAQRLRHQIATQTRALFNRIDLLATPTTARTAPLIRPAAETQGESDLVVLDALMRYAVLANLTGLPAISCPISFDRGQLPIGIQLMGKPFAEGELLRAAFALDRASPKRRAPHWFCPHPAFAR